MESPKSSSPVPLQIAYGTITYVALNPFEMSPGVCRRRPPVQLFSQGRIEKPWVWAKITCQRSSKRRDVSLSHKLQTDPKDRAVALKK